MSNYKEDLKIDIYKLEEECASQPSLYMDYGEEFAEALFERDLAKQNLKIVTSQVTSKVRTDPKLYGVIEGARGYTEAAYQAAVDVSEEVKEAEMRLIKAQKEVEIQRTAKEAFEDRKRQLTNLVHLILGQYYSDPEKAASKEAKSMQNQALSENPRLKKL